MTHQSENSGGADPHAEVEVQPQYGSGEVHPIFKWSIIASPTALGVLAAYSVHEMDFSTRTEVVVSAVALIAGGVSSLTFHRAGPGISVEAVAEEDLARSHMDSGGSSTLLRRLGLGRGGDFTRRISDEPPKPLYEMNKEGVIVNMDGKPLQRTGFLRKLTPKVEEQ